MRRALLLVAAVIAAVLLLAVTIDLGRFPLYDIKALAERRATDYLLRPVHIGRLSATLWPGIFALDDVVIEGKHAGDRPFFKAGRVYAYLPWTTLFNRRV